MQEEEVLYLSIYLFEEGEGQEGRAGGGGIISIYLRKVTGKKAVQEGEREVVYQSIFLSEKGERQEGRACPLS